MGYTHYWNHDGFTDHEWDQVKEQAPKVVAASDVVVQFESDEVRPLSDMVTDDLLRFNGVEDEGHETFYFTRGGCEFNFCKTAMKPYDEVVVAMLIMMSRIKPAFSWSSDGDPEDHVAGHDLYVRAVS